MFFNLKKIFGSGIVLTALIITGCGDRLLEPADALTKTVSIPRDLYYYVPDSATCANLYNQTYTPGIPALTKPLSPLVKIDPEKIEVIVTWFDEAAWDRQELDQQNYWEEFWSDPTKNEKRWDHQLEFYQSNPDDQLIYHGKLEREGDFAKGNISVRQGHNRVIIGFVMPGDTVPFLAQNGYNWNVEGEPDGWTYSLSLSDTLKIGDYFEQ